MPAAGRDRTSSRNASDRASRSSATRMKSRIAPSTSRSVVPVRRSAAMASMSRRWYALSSLRASSDRPARSAGGPGQRSHRTPPEGRDPAERARCLEHAVALDAPVNLGPLAQLVGQVDLVPARHAAGGHARVQQLVGAAEERIQGLCLVALLQAPVRQLRDVPRGGRALEVVAEPQPRMADADLRDDVERAAPGERHVELRERLEGATETGCRAADALRDDPDLAVLGRDQRQDPVGLPQVEPGEDDAVGDVAARGGHGPTVALAAGDVARRRARSSGGLGARARGACGRAGRVAAYGVWRIAGQAPGGGGIVRLPEFANANHQGVREPAGG